MALGSESAKRIYLQQSRGVQLQVLLQHAQVITDNGAVTGQFRYGKEACVQEQGCPSPRFQVINANQPVTGRQLVYTDGSLRRWIL